MKIILAIVLLCAVACVPAWVYRRRLMHAALVCVARPVRMVWRKSGLLRRLAQRLKSRIKAAADGGGQAVPRYLTQSLYSRDLRKNAS